jgi:hypothetical protein
MDEHTRRKWEALNRFTQKLLSGPCGAQVAKIVLFGSVAKKSPVQKVTWMCWFSLSTVGNLCGRPAPKPPLR